MHSKVKDTLEIMVTNHRELLRKLMWKHVGFESSTDNQGTSSSLSVKILLTDLAKFLCAADYVGTRIEAGAVPCGRAEPGYVHSSDKAM
ncbi:hypothetical protein V6N13_077230 [Hibiscus sabdariffa]